MEIEVSARNNRHLVVFKVDPYCFCAPAADVERFIMVPPVSRVPKTPPSVIGLINHRGQVYRVISLRRKLGLETGPPQTAGQLILTNLSTGLTAFLVDEVVDVLPYTDLIRRPLSPHSAMDLFDAFILRNEQVLFHTTFAQIEQAQETPYPSPDLKAMERLETKTTPTDPDPEDLATLYDQSSSDGQHTERRPTRPAEPEPEVTHDIAPSEKISPSGETRGRATPGYLRKAPAPHEGSTAAEQYDGWANPAQPIGIFSVVSRRIRRYALSLTAVLLLIVIAVLSSLWLLHGRKLSRDRYSPATRGTTPPTNATIPKTNEELSESIRRQELPKTLPEKLEPSTSPVDQQAEYSSAAERVNKEATPPLSVTQSEMTLSPEQANGSMDVTDLPLKTPESPREILRMETETFTLSVERPSTDRVSPEASPKPQTPVVRTEVIHFVVRGDTL